jgi:hypothetical protein
MPRKRWKPAVNSENGCKGVARRNSPPFPSNELSTAIVDGGAKKLVNYREISEKPTYFVAPPLMIISFSG